MVFTIVVLLKSLDSLPCFCLVMLTARFLSLIYALVRLPSVELVLLKSQKTPFLLQDQLFFTLQNLQLSTVTGFWNTNICLMPDLTIIN